MGRPNLLFDLDGTLTDSREGILRSIGFALEAVGVHDVDPDDGCVGPPLLDSLDRLLGPERRHLIPRAAEQYRRRYCDAGIRENQPYDGIRECLRELEALANLYVVTSNLSAISERVLAHLELDRHFRRIHGCQDWHGADKGGLIRDLLASEGLDPAASVMIGDRQYDIEGARKNRIASVGILWGYGEREELISAGAELIFEHPRQLTRHFSKDHPR